MADDDPKKGVVDRESRVHGIPNLHVAGSSVFPTGGAAPPTPGFGSAGVSLRARRRGDGVEAVQEES